MDNLLTKVIATQQQARKAGFDWPNAYEVIKKIQEELIELEQALQNQSQTEVLDEFGDVLLAVINLSLQLKIDIQQSLELSLDKFNTRYQAMLQLAHNKNLHFEELNLQQKEALWQTVKKIL